MNEQIKETLSALRAALDWIDAVPSDVQLPTMPGFDRDWAESLFTTPEVEPVIANIDVAALEASRKIMKVVNGSWLPGGATQVQAKIQCIVADVLSQSPQEQGALESERLRKEQADAVMPLIGPLLDAYERADQCDLADVSESLLRHLKAINQAMEHGRPADSADKVDAIADTKRLDFLISFGSTWHVQWEQRPGKAPRYRMIDDGEPWGKWHDTPRAAIDQAMKEGERK